jgi:hypothetical protein
MASRPCMRWLCSTVNATLSPDAIKAYVEALKHSVAAKDPEVPRPHPPCRPLLVASLCWSTDVLSWQLRWRPC